ncbi:MAG TPA: hypothetical protein VGF86_05950 [Candidatus Tumulicola sp.]|jgi:hypothetical protein
MTGAPIAVRVVAAIGIGLVVAALGYAIASGRAFLFPFLLLLGFPMASVFRHRRNPPGETPPRISLN